MKNVEKRLPDVGFVLRFRRCPRPNCGRLWAYVKVVGLGAEIVVDLRAFCDCGMGLQETGTAGRIDLGREYVEIAPMAGAEGVAAALVARYVPQMQAGGLIPDGIMPHPTMLKDVCAPLTKALVNAAKVLAEPASERDPDGDIEGNGRKEICVLADRDGRPSP